MIARQLYNKPLHILFSTSFRKTLHKFALNLPTQQFIVALLGFLIINLIDFTGFIQLRSDNLKKITLPMRNLQATILLCCVIMLTVCSRHFKVSLGSCSLQNKGQNLTIFNTILKDRPNYFVHLGDIVYLDKQGTSSLNWAPEKNPFKIQKRYEDMSQSVQYKNLIAKTRFRSVWDDHDSGVNNGDSTNPLLPTCLKLYKEQFNVRNVAFPDSLFQFEQIDPWVKLILLDSRSYKTLKSMFDNQYVWIWLEQIFMNTKPYELVLLGCGTQVIYDDRLAEQSWVPADRLRLYKLLYKYQIHAIFMSGDVHFGEIGKRKVYEITSSGLTFSVQSFFKNADVFIKNFYPQTYSRGEDRFTNINYGMIDITMDDYKSQQIFGINGNTMKTIPVNGVNNFVGISNISLQIRDINGGLRVQKIFNFKDTLIEPFDDNDIGNNHIELYTKNKVQKLIKFPELAPLGVDSAIMSALYAIPGKKFPQKTK